VQAAIDAAIGGETIRICAGLYTEDLTIDQDLTLIGAGDGNSSGNTILQGSGTFTVVRIDVGITVSLQRLRITGGAGAFEGGGIRNFGKLGLTDCTVTGNNATSFGGGILNGGTSLTLTGCRVSGNTAGINGGGIFARSPVELINSSVTGNTADNGGGIIHVAPVTLTGSTVSGNTASDLGGGIVSTGPLKLINSDVTGNTAGTRGGGIFNSSIGTVTCDAASRVTENHASPGNADNGGGVFNFGTVTLSSADNVTGNTPDNCGGIAVPLCNG